MRRATRHADRPLYRPRGRHRSARRRCLEPSRRRAGRHSVGAPPDEFNPAGQDWGLAPFNPHALPADDFAAVRAVDACRHAARRRHPARPRARAEALFMMPRGCGARQAPMCAFRCSRLLRVIDEEGNRHRCIVIGEDLGTVPEDFRETHRAMGVLGLPRDAVRARARRPLSHAGTLSGRGARDLQHARHGELSWLDGRTRYARQTRDRLRSRRERRRARAGASRAARRAGALDAANSRPTTSPRWRAFLA